MGSPHKELTPRQRDILAWIEDQGFATIESLASRFDVSMQTIRREIIRLDASGHLQRFHGGAGLPEGRIRLGYAGKSALAKDAKEQIGQTIAGLIPDGSAVFLDVGTTTEAAARALLARRSLQIVTNSLNCARVFQGVATIQTFVLGGSLRGADGSLIGDTTLSGLDRFKADVAVIGCSAVEDDGAVMDYDIDKIAVKRAVLATARRRILAVDSLKFRRHAVARIGSLTDFTDIVSDAPLPADIAECLGRCRQIIARPD